jgi:hypothetical protein
MKFWRKQNLLPLLLILILFGGNSSLNDTAKASPGGCRDATVCFDGSLTPCIPLPTTMPPVDSEYTGGYGFIFRSSNCGAKKCYWFFACRCGPGLGAGICRNSLASGSCSREEKKGAEIKEASAD